MALHGHVGPVLGSLQLTPFKGDRENESCTGLGGGERRKLNSVHGRLDDFGLEFVVSDSNKDSLRVHMRRDPWGREPSGLPQQCCPDPFPPSSVLAAVWAQLWFQSPRGFLRAQPRRGATLWLVVFGFGVVFWTVSVFLFCFLSLVLSTEL